MMNFGRNFKIVIVAMTLLSALAIFISLLSGELDSIVPFGVFFLPLAVLSYFMRNAEPEFLLRDSLRFCWRFLVTALRIR